MKIKFKKKRLYANLVLGLIWVIIAPLSLLKDEGLNWSDYIYFGIGVFYLAHYVYDLKHQYLEIEDGVIKKNSLYGFRKKMNLKDIDRVEKFAGDYTLKSNDTKLKINTSFIESQSLTSLVKTLSELNLPTEKTPFIK
ncbi:hypothetical protein [Leeuwenhoekiella sp. W20_SRS_FM14]|uniref:hypothetical protein n=1 Tax=Leeuwenhoekiella sp. W20_SRS_FM14 TaxID=3240270 RepID=UPI003F9BC7A0